MPGHQRTLAGILTTLLAAAWFLTAATAAQAEPAAAQASCYGPSCAGLSPVTTGCVNSQRTLASIVIYGVAGREFLVEHRYSSACYASWTRISNRSTNPDCTIGTVAFHQGWWNDGRLTRTPTASIGPSCSTYTVMMSEHNKSTRACGYSDFEGQSRCTGWKLAG